MRAAPWVCGRRTPSVSGCLKDASGIALRSFLADHKQTCFNLTMIGSEADPSRFPEPIVSAGIIGLRSGDFLSDAGAPHKVTGRRRIFEIASTGRAIEC